MVVDLRVLDTHPGARTPASPRAGWGGTGEQYQAALRRRAGRKTSFGQLLLAAAHHARDGEYGHPVEVIGPFAEEAREVLVELGARPDLVRVLEDVG